VVRGRAYCVWWHTTHEKGFAMATLTINPHDSGANAAFQIPVPSDGALLDILKAFDFALEQDPRRGMFLKVDARRLIWIPATAVLSFDFDMVENVPAANASV